MKKLSRKEKIAQKALIFATNELIRQEKITLEPTNNHGEYHIVRFDIGGIPAVASCADIGHGELSLHVALWPTPKGYEHIRSWISAPSLRLSMGGFYTSGWLERKNGAWIQSSNGFPNTSSRSGLLAKLESLPWEEPLGFLADGQFYT